MRTRAFPATLIVIALAALLACRNTNELVIHLKAESEIDPLEHGRLAVLDFAYSGEIEFGVLAAERLRDRIGAGGRFAVVRGAEATDPEAPLYDLAGEELTAALARTLESGADALVTGRVVFIRQGAADYAERLAESYDIEETESPSMVFGRSGEADERRTGVVYTLEVSVRAYDVESGEVIWRRSSSERAETDSTNRTPTRSELMGMFNTLLRPVVEDLRLSLEPHLRAETRYVVP